MNDDIYQSHRIESLIMQLSEKKLLNIVISKDSGVYYDFKSFIKLHVTSPIFKLLTFLIFTITIAHQRAICATQNYV